MVPRLCVPEIQRFEARNWNLAASGAPFTASNVANRVGVSTPFSGARSVMVMVVFPFGLVVGGWWLVVGVLRLGDGERSRVAAYAAADRHGSPGAATGARRGRSASQMASS